MRKAKVYVHGVFAGWLEEISPGEDYRFRYTEGYVGPGVSLTMPTEEKTFRFSGFPPFFEGLLPEGIMLEGLLRQLKIDRRDYFTQLIATGKDLVGAVTVESTEDE